MIGNERPTHTHVYRARVNRVIDGDTLDLTIDVGFLMTTTQRVRLMGINAPETRGTERPEGLRSKAVVENWASKLAGDWPLLIHTEKGDAFGRWIAYVWSSGSEKSLNDFLVDHGLAERREY